MRKIDKFLAIFSRVLASPKGRISIEEVQKLTGSKATHYRVLADLTGFTIDSEPLFNKVSEGEREYLILNRSMFKYFVPEHLDTAFIFESYRKVGALIKSSNFDEDVKHLKKEVFNLNGHAEEFNRKFHYLDKVTRKEVCDEVDIRLSSIISALISNYKLNLIYNNKHYNEVLPLSLIQYRDALYLMISKDEKLKDVRTLKLDRLSHVEVLDIEFKYPKSIEWDPEKEFDGASGIISGDIKKAHIRVYDKSRIHISEKAFFDKTLKDTTANYDEYEIKFTCEDELLGQLFVYAQDIEILSPSTLTQSFYDKALAAVVRNKMKRAS